MSEKKEVGNEAGSAGETTAEERPLVVVFRKPYEFEKKKYDSVDLGGLELMTGQDMLQAERELRSQGLTSLTADITADGLLKYASVATNQPIEFFECLPLREARKVKMRVLNFLLE